MASAGLLGALHCGYSGFPPRAAVKTSNPAGECNVGDVAIVTGTNAGENHGDIAVVGTNTGENEGDYLAVTTDNRGYQGARNLGGVGVAGKNSGDQHASVAITGTNEPGAFNHYAVVAVSGINKGYNYGAASVVGMNDDHNGEYLNQDGIATVTGINDGSAFGWISATGQNKDSARSAYASVVGVNEQTGYHQSYGVAVTGVNSNNTKGAVAVTGLGGKTECDQDYGWPYYPSPYGTCVAASVTGDTQAGEPSPFTSLEKPGVAISGTGKANGGNQGTGVSATDQATGYNAVSSCTGVKLGGVQRAPGTGVCV